MGLSMPRPACLSCPHPCGLFLGAEVLDGEQTWWETWSSSWGWKDPPWSPPGACMLSTPGRAPGGHSLGDGQRRPRHLPSWWEPPALGEHNSTGPCPLALRVPLGKGLHVLRCPGLAPPSAQLPTLFSSPGATLSHKFRLSLTHPDPLVQMGACVCRAKANSWHTKGDHPGQKLSFPWPL